MEKTESGFQVVYVLTKMFQQGRRRIPLQELVGVTGLEYHIVWYRISTWIEDGFIHSLNPKVRYENLLAKDLRMRRHLVIDLTSTKWALETLFLCMWREEWEKNAENKYQSIFGAKQTKLTLVKAA